MYNSRSIPQVAVMVAFVAESKMDLVFWLSRGLHLATADTSPEVSSYASSNFEARKWHRHCRQSEGVPGQSLLNQTGRLASLKLRTHEAAGAP